MRLCFLLLILTSALALAVPPPEATPPPPFFLRVTMLTPGTPATKGQVLSSWYSSPYAGAKPLAMVSGDGGFVANGETPPWVEISGLFNHKNKGPAAIRVQFSCQGGAPLPASWRARVEFATAPDAGAVVRVDEEDWDGDNLIYVVPYEAASQGAAAQIPSIHEAAAKRLVWAQGLDLPGGKGDFSARYFHIQAQAGGRSKRQIEDEMRVCRQLGFNSPFLWSYLDIRTPRAGEEIGYAKKAAVAAGLDLSKSFFPFYGVQWKCAFDPEAKAAMVKKFEEEFENLRRIDPEIFARLHEIVLNDEPAMKDDLRHMPECPHCQAAFRDWLRSKGVTPEMVGFQNWQEVKPIMPAHTGSLEVRRLSWYSHRFSVENALRPVRIARDAIERIFGRTVQTRINPSDAAVAREVMSINGNGWDFFVAGRQELTSIPWTEDWVQSSPHVTPFLADLLRSSQKTRLIPLGMYIIYGWIPSKEPHFGQLKTMSAVARGVKYVNHYLYGPRSYYGGNTYSEDPTYFQDVAFINRVLALSDDVLGPALPPERKVAILWSSATDQWFKKWDPVKNTKRNDGAFGIERRMLHWALMMQQVPVDFLDETDLVSRLKDYKVLYLPATNLVAECVPVLENWVKSGGTLVVGNGGPQRDEFDEPLPGFLAIQGLTSVERRDDDLRYIVEHVVAPKPSSMVTFVGSSVPIGVAGIRNVLVPGAGASVLASYQEGGAAVVESRLGRGRVVTFGFNPGIALLMKMDPSRLLKLPVFWNVFPKDELTMILRPVQQADVLPPVSTQVGVDAARLDGPNGSAVTLANYTLQPIAKLNVTVRGLPRVGKVVSVLRGSLAYRQSSQGLMVELPLEAVDVLKFYPAGR